MRIPPRPPEGPPLLNDTGQPAFTRHWQLEPPQDSLVVVVKGTFALVPGGEAVPAEDPVLPTGEEPFEDGPALRYPGDIAVFKPMCDVLVDGHAYAPGGAAVTRFGLRFGDALRLGFAAFGARVWTSRGPSAPEPVEAVRLRPEHAFGGPRHPLNPLGCGHGARVGDPLPRLERLDAPIANLDDRPEPVLLNPLAENHPLRQAHVGSYDGAWASKRFPWFPEDFDWAFFQSAPPELRVPHPSPRAPYALEGMHPTLPTVEGRLPASYPRAFAVRSERPDAFEEVRLRLDTVFFEPDAMRLLLSWRGFFAVSDLYARDVATLFVTWGRDGESLALDEVAQRYEQEYARLYESAPPELDAPDPIDAEEAVPEGRRRPRGLTPRAARALGLPSWTAGEVDAPGPEIGRASCRERV
jgi:hypothetical protein